MPDNATNQKKRKLTKSEREHKALVIHHLIETEMSYGDGLLYLINQKIFDAWKPGDDPPLSKAQYYRWLQQGRRDQEAYRVKLLDTGLVDRFFSLKSGIEMRRQLSMGIALNARSAVARVQAMEMWEECDRRLAKIDDEYAAIQKQQIDLKESLRKDLAMKREDAAQEAAAHKTKDISTAEPVISTSEINAEETNQEQI